MLEKGRSNVLELEMKTTAYDPKILDKKMRIKKSIDNACLSEWRNEDILNERIQVHVYRAILLENSVDT